MTELSFCGPALNGDHLVFSDCGKLKLAVTGMYCLKLTNVFGPMIYILGYLIKFIGGIFC